MHSQKEGKEGAEATTACVCGEAIWGRCAPAGGGGRDVLSPSACSRYLGGYALFFFGAQSERVNRTDLLK